MGPLLLWLAGVDGRRSLPRFAARTFRRSFAPQDNSRKPVVLFTDSFSDAFSPEVAEATVRVLRAAGYEPRLPSGSTCCGLTWITTGQLGAAKRILTRTVDVLAADARTGMPIVGIEPVVHSRAAVRRAGTAPWVGGRRPRGEIRAHSG